MLSAVPRLLVFDLDGTLIDSRVDLCNAVNATLASSGRPALSEEIITSYVGDGVTSLVRRALTHTLDAIPTANQVQRSVDFFLGYYRVHKLDATYVYPGVIDALETIHRVDPRAQMAVLTNKPVVPSREICKYFGLERFFFQNYGGNSFVTKKPDPLGLTTLMAEATSLLRLSDSDAAVVSGADTCVIGDSDVDVLTARNGNCRSIGCTFGLSPDSLRNVKPDLLAHSPSDWPGCLGIT